MDGKRDKPLTVIGLMSGTSLDGCDAVLMEISKSNGKRLHLRTIDFITHPMPDSLRAAIKKQLNSETSRIDELASLDNLLSSWFAEAVKALLTKSNYGSSQVDLIGSHGQTMWHAPSTTTPMTWQLGDGSFIAAITEITTVCDFRTADIALGGQGAPLVPFFDNLQFGDSDQTVALQNIGGIGNVTLLPKAGSRSAPLGFDTGPGNMIIDRFMENASNGRDMYDKDGATAARGAVCEELLQAWLKHPFFEQLPPKSTGREEFGHAYADQRYAEAVARGLSTEEALATITALTARTIADAYAKSFSTELFPQRIIVSGGGAHNKCLLQMLRDYLPAGVCVLTAEEVGISSDAKEAVAFAVFAYLAVHGICNHLPETTGAREQTILGKICPGKNFQQVLLKSVAGSPSWSEVSRPHSSTESRNAATMELDLLAPETIVSVMNDEDRHVVDVVNGMKSKIARVAQQMAESIAKGGHVFYLGAGSSGRLGVLDASEIPPTFSAPREWFQGMIAGGDTALRTAIEGAEDSAEGGAQDIASHGVGPNDIVVGIAASRGTPYVHGALRAAKKAGAVTALITCNTAVTQEVFLDTVLQAVVGPEILTGSTRLKAGTATKMVLNQLSTTAMVLLGKVYGNLMVDLKVTNAKLKRRAISIIQTVTAVDAVEAEELLAAAGNSVKLAIAMKKTGKSREEAEELLRLHKGILRKVIDG